MSCEDPPVFHVTIMSEVRCFLGHPLSHSMDRATQTRTASSSSQRKNDLRFHDIQKETDRKASAYDIWKDADRKASDLSLLGDRDKRASVCNFFTESDGSIVDNELLKKPEKKTTSYDLKESDIELEEPHIEFLGQKRTGSGEKTFHTRTHARNTRTPTHAKIEFSYLKLNFIDLIPLFVCFFVRDGIKFRADYNSARVVSCVVCRPSCVCRPVLF